MRKKYLSALLFGALLFASAGTFTSCKDYDDDINNLQEQINTIASSLDDLKTKVDALGGYVENVTFADGVLSVTTGGNTVTYNIPDKTGVNEVALALEGNNLVLTVDGNKQTIELPSQEIPEIKVENGILYVGDKEYPLTVDVDNNVQIVDDNIPGNETIGVQINGETVAFPKAFANVRISLETYNDDNGFVFTEYNNGKQATSWNNCHDQKYGIHWAIASKDFEWDGPKDAPKAGEMVVGQITAAKVSVRPINFDLTTADLKLVSSVGEEAAVKVIPHPSQDNGPLSTESRSASVTYDQVKQGDYVLTLEFDKDKKAEDMIHDFATSDNNANIKYALSVNGVIVTDYQFVIDTQLKADAQQSCAEVEGSYFAIGGVTGNLYQTDPEGVKYYNNMPVGTHQMSYLDGRIYDMKVEIDDSSKSDANVYGVVINEDGTIKAGDNAAGRTFKLKVTLIDVNGNKSKTAIIGVTFTKAENSQVVTLDASTYKVFPNSNSFVINLGDVFTSLDDKDAITLKNANKITWAIENNDQEFVTSGTLYDINGKEIYILDENACNIQYYKDEACTQDVNLNDQTNGEDVKSIRYAKITIKQSNNKASVGEHLLSISLYRDNGIYGDYDNVVRETIKKVNIPVHVQLPAWNEVFKTNDNWADGKFVSRLTNLYVNAGGNGGGVELPMNAFAATDAAWLEEANNIDLVKLTYKDQYDGMNEKPACLNEILPTKIGIEDNNAIMNYNALTQKTAETGKLAFTEMTAEAVYAYDNYDNFKIYSDTYTVKILSLMENAQLLYDKKKEAVLDKNNHIDGSKFVLSLNGFDINIAGANTPDKGFENNLETGTLKIEGGTKELKFFEASGYPIAPANSVRDIFFQQVVTSNNLTGLTATLDVTGVQINVPAGGTIEQGQSGKYTINFRDAMGVTWSQEITYKK